MFLKKFLIDGKKAGDITSVQMVTQSYSTDAGLSYSYLTASSNAYVDASYVRLRNLSVSYNFRETWMNKLNLQNLRIYGQAQNLITITNYKGLDPETGGLSVLPTLRVVTMGMQLTL